MPMQLCFELISIVFAQNFLFSRQLEDDCKGNVKISALLNIQIESQQVNY
jgi:hypothetical protein